ncbi:YdcF family protein [Aquitalea aquatilis]|uniref:YdcF family protein n=1 Tax=Aquitalea aquatilis TaxID=1537400 RepID=UPI0010BD837D|nr:YdcF family protein [Aquitalea aquatilis]
MSCPTTPTLQRASLLWDFLSAGRSHQPCDVLVVCGSYDLRVVDHAVGLLQRGVAPRMLISGNTGNWTRDLWSKPEAEVFAERALQLGISQQQLLLEPRAGNFAENLAFSRALCPDARSVTFVTKPNSIRRVMQTQPVQWPGISCSVDAPDFAFPWGVSNMVGVFGLIEEMVGDIHRLLRYPRLGFQQALQIPPVVLQAWQQLIAQGYNRHLLRGSALDDLPAHLAI